MSTDGIEKFNVTIIGTKPLLMHSPAGIGKSSTKKSNNYDPMEEATAVLYLNSDNVICVPSMAILGALRKAATEHKAKGRGRKTLRDFVYSGLVIDEELIPLPNQEWVVDARPVVVQRSRIMRWRPRFDKWELKFTISIVDPSVWNGTDIRNILEDAGKFVGLLDFRPLFGLFKVQSMINTNTGKEVK
jgi:hypothetical protein